MVLAADGIAPQWASLLSGYCHGPHLGASLLVAATSSEGTGISPLWMKLGGREQHTDVGDGALIEWDAPGAGAW